MGGGPPTAADGHCRCGETMTELQKLAWKGSAKRLRTYLEKRGSGDLDPEELAEATRYALVSGQAEKVELLFARGATISQLGSEGDSFLTHAIIGGNPLLVERMVALGCDPCLSNVNGRTPLIWAADSGRPEVVRLLLAAGAEVNHVPRVGDPPLLESLRKDRGEETPLLLLAAGADVHARSATDGSTALHLAAGRGYPAVVRELLRRGAEVDAPGGHTRERPLAAAARSGNVQVVHCLLEAGADPLALDGSGRDVLFNAAFKSPGLVRVLVEAAPALVHAEYEGRTPLDVAVAAGNEEVVAYLLERRARVQATEEFRGSALVDAAIGGRLGVIEQLLRHPDTRIDYRAHALGRTALMAALGMRNGEAVALRLLDAGADPAQRDRQGFAALHHAVRGMSPILVERLLDLGQPVDEPAEGGLTPLMLAVGNRETLRSTADRVAVVELLLARGADVHARDASGRTPLLHVALDRGAKTAAVLLQAGSDVNAVDSTGHSLLALAAQYGSYDDRYRRPRSRKQDVVADLVELLLNAGADPNLHGPYGTMLQHAEHLRCREVVRLLMAHGAKSA